MKNDLKIIDFTPDNIGDYGMCGYKDSGKHKELRNKIDWFKEYYNKGLRIKGFISGEGLYQGMIEYIPGEFAHRPVNASGYLFIHCIFMGFKKEFKGKGYASALIQECIQEAKKNNFIGVAVVTRKGSFMADSNIFSKNGFEIVDSTTPDFNLLAIKFSENSINPCFKKDSLENLQQYKNGLTIIRSVQCPYTEKNVAAILETASKKYHLNVKLIDITTAAMAQQTPCAFGTFCIIYNGKVISHHPISNTRYENIMKKLLK